MHGTDSLVSRCFNMGDIKINNGAEFSGAGGIAGKGGNTTVKIQSCYNTGDIEIVANERWCIAGGIFCGTANITQCYNRGNVNIKKAEESECIGANAGGISGGVSGAIKISNCFNTAAVSTDVTNGRAGGIIGVLEDGLVKIENCLYAASQCTSGVFANRGNIDVSTVTSFTGDETLQNILDLLGEDYTGEGSVDGYPILKWQVE